MAYNREDLEKKCLAAIKKYKIAHVRYLLPHLPCCEKTFYNLELQEVQAIKDALNEQKRKRKAKLIDKWEQSENATLSIAAFKLLAEDDELERLTSNKHDHTTKGDKIKGISPITWVDGSEDK